MDDENVFLFSHGQRFNREETPFLFSVIYLVIYFIVSKRKPRN